MRKWSVVLFFMSALGIYICENRKIMEDIIYYVNSLNKKKRTGFIFNIIPYPKTIQLHFQVFSILFFAILGALLNLSIIVFIFLAPLLWDHFYTSHLRNEILDKCLDDEYFFYLELKKGPDPNFPDDPLYVTQDDRESIFDEVWSNYFFNNKNRYPNFKIILRQHSLYIILLPILFFLTYHYVYLIINFYHFN